jgi:CheY-like chemotaxis protein
LCQILDNLLTNSLKFTETPGEVRVVLETRRGKECRLTVSDTGQGMAPEILEVIFEPFRQGRRDQGSGGLGLGLSLVKLLAELHDGHASVRSEGWGRGTEVEVVLPVIEEPDHLPLDDNPVNIRSWRLLCVEDLADVARSQCKMLRNAGHEVRHCPDGESALGAVAEVTPEAILCDLGLPGELDGLALAREFRKLESLAHVPLIAVTGFGTQDDRHKSREAGFDAHINKPLDMDKLHRILASLDETPLSGTVLVVDDQKMISRTTSLILEKEGYVVLTAGSVREAKEVFEREMIDVAIVDHGLPDGDGVELFRDLKRRRPSLQGVAVSGADSPEAREKSAEAGCLRHLVKPVPAEVLKKAVLEARSRSLGSR